MFRVGILKTNGDSIGETFNTKAECEDWLLEQAEKCNIKKAIIINKEDRNDKEFINF